MVDLAAAVIVGAITGALAWRRQHSVQPTLPAAIVVLVVLGLWWSSALLAIVGPMLAAMAAMEHRRRSRTEADRRLTRQFPVVVDQLIQRLQSGHSLHTVVAELDDGPVEISSVLAPAAKSLRARSTLEAAIGALDGSGGGCRDRRVELLAATLSTLARSGGPAVPALQRLRFTLIGFVQAEDQAAAQAGQALASAALLAFAPGLFSIVVAAVDADARHLYVHEPIGTVCVAGAVCLSYGGWRWMLHTVRRVSSTDPSGGR